MTPRLAGWPWAVILTEFDTVDVSAATLDPGLCWDVDYGAMVLTLTVVDFILGDMTGDCLVNLGDVPAFVLALVDRPAYDLTYSFVNADAAGDIDGSGTFDLGDTASFSGLFSGPATALLSEPAVAPAVPEPTTLSLTDILLLGIAIRQRRRG